MGVEVKNDSELPDQPSERNELPSASRPNTDAFEGLALNPNDGKKANALFALERAEAHLREHGIGAAKVAADEMLSLITLAKVYRVTDLPTPVGHRDDEGLDVGGEFGSTSSDWRLGGAIAATPVALSVSSRQHENGNSFVMLRVTVPEEVVAFGLEGHHFDATLMFFPDENIARLSVKSPGDAVESGDWIQEMERVFDFSTAGKPLPEFNWGHDSYTVRQTGVNRLKRQSNVSVSG